MDEFLKIEYEQCMELLKYYDGRQISLARFATAISAAVASVIFGVNDLRTEVSENYWGFVALLSCVTALGLTTIYLGMVQNRLYFVYPARQVNWIRKVMLDRLGEQARGNQMYTDSTFGAFRLRSAHSLANLFVCLQVGIFVALSVFALGSQAGRSEFLFLISTLVGVVGASVLFGASARYLVVHGRRHPDERVSGIGTIKTP